MWGYAKSHMVLGKSLNTLSASTSSSAEWGLGLNYLGRMDLDYEISFFCEERC